MRTAERVSAGERDEASMVTSSPSLSDFDPEGARVGVDEVDAEGDEIAAFALTSAATLVSIFNAFSDCFLKYALLLLLTPSSPWFCAPSLLSSFSSSRFF